MAAPIANKHRRLPRSAETEVASPYESDSNTELRVYGASGISITKSRGRIMGCIGTRTITHHEDSGKVAFP
ncbi:hypothetical protein C1H46_021954 [Malus baccata]|uniref:Uncharacterized protein n=1 Tax=Malus baccata TaxID=106549 RepID=A0A540M0Y6_MALBA|nr:hypothetical protein C1H46_021954 [Malus baccata]